MYFRFEDNHDTLDYIKTIVPAAFRKIDHLFSQSELKYITYHSKTQVYHGIFHGLPKLHKNKPLDQIPFRPIIAGRPHQLQARVSTVLSTKLIPVLDEYPTVLKNSFELIEDLEGRLCIDHSFVSLDFESLYTSIPLLDLYSTIRNCTTSNLLNYRFKESTISILKFIFSHNYFEFAEKYYLQTDGIAMGTNVAPILANLYLAIKFDSIFQNLDRTKYFRRFIDDCFFLYNGTQEDFENNELLALREQAHPINITYEFNNTSVNFLDLTVYNNNDTIAFKVFQKPLNQYHYIPHFSNHPGHNLSGFIKGELIRYKRISTQEQDFQYIKSRFYERLVKRGYPKNLLNNIFSQELFRQIPIEWSQLTPIQKEEIFNFAIHLSNQLRILQFLNTLFKSFAARFNLDFNNNIKIRIALKSNPNILQLTTCSKLSREKVALVSERLSQ